MSKLYKEYFYVPKYSKIREKVMLTHVVMTVSIIIMCLVAMSITAYAYFSYNIISGSNVIKAANFDAQITVTNTDQNDETVNPSSTDGKKTTFIFANAGTYTVNLEKGNSTAKTGFCIVYIGNDKYHTQQIGVDINANNSERELVAFVLKVNEPNTVVTIESHWGTSYYYNFDINEENTFYIMNDPRREIVIGNPVNGVSNSDEEKETTSDETTATETTPTDVVHTVVVNETLSAIARKYGASVDQIAAYNKIANPNSILVGQQLKIPPADYEVPTGTIEQTTTTSETTTPTTETTGTPTTEASK